MLIDFHSNGETTNRKINFVLRTPDLTRSFISLPKISAQMLSRKNCYSLDNYLDVTEGKFFSLINKFQGATSSYGSMAVSR